MIFVLSIIGTLQVNEKMTKLRKRGGIKWN